MNKTADIVNDIIWGNILNYNSSGYIDDIYAIDSTVTLSYCNYGDSYNIIDGGNNLQSNPLFVDYNNGDYHLKSQAGHYVIPGLWTNDTETSPCIDAGDPAASYANEPQDNGNRINMGYYGNTAQASKSYYAMLTVNITPSNAVANGAKWTLLTDAPAYYDSTWHDSGDSIAIPPNTNFYIGVKDIEGYILTGDSSFLNAYNSFDGGIIYTYNTSESFTTGQNTKTMNYKVANDIYVSGNGNNNGTGNLYQPFKTIQYAINSDIGNIIYVKASTYYENINIDRSVSIIGYGNYKPTISGGSGTAPAVIISANGMLSDFIITGGDGNYGGGMYVGWGAAEIRNCDFKNNNAGFLGGALYCQGASSNVKFFNCTFGTISPNKVNSSSIHSSAEIFFDSILNLPTFIGCSIRGGLSGPYCNWPGK